MSIINKLLSGLAVVGGFLAFVFYVMFDQEKAERIKAQSKQKVAEAEKEATDVAREQHEAVKEEGGVSVANDVADMLDND